MSHILDDFIFFGPKDSNISSKSLATFELLAQSLQLPLKQEKTVLPTTRVILHGILVDTVAMRLELPEDKLLGAKDLIKKLIQCKKAPLKLIQSLIGTLQFACRAIIPGRAFLRRIIDLTRGVHSKNHRVRLTREARLDLKAWLAFLDEFNGRVLVLPELFQNSKTLKLFSDSSGLSCAAILGSNWIKTDFPAAWCSTNIAIKELLPIVIAVRLWCDQLRDKRILFFTDNLAIVSVINNTTSKDKMLMLLVRQLVVVCLTNNILFKAKHIPGRHNVIPDLLSRSQVAKARSLAPWLAQEQSPIPEGFLPW